MPRQFSAVEVMSANRALLASLDSLTVNLAFLKGATSNGAIIPEYAISRYLRAVIKNNDVLDYEEMHDIISYLAANGASVNYKIKTFAIPDQTLLQYATNLLFSYDETLVNEKRLALSLSLIKNGASYLDLHYENKIALVKAILKSKYPARITDLIKKGLVSPSFKIDGQDLIEYARNNISSPIFKDEVVQFLQAQPYNLDLIQAAKIKHLRRQLTMSASDASPEAQEKLRAQLHDGVSIKKDSAQFVSLQENGREKTFLQKKSNSVESKFGSDIFRILSRKKYAAKRELLTVDEETLEIFSAIKWDGSIAGNWFLNQDDEYEVFQRSVKHDQKFVNRYAYMCGVMHVLGEPDHNDANFLRSSKTNLPVHIDSSPLVNNYPGLAEIYKEADQGLAPYGLARYERKPIYGAAQSAKFLRTYLVDPQDASAATTEVSRNINVHHAQDFEKFVQAFDIDFNGGIDEKLFAKIKENIEKPQNAHLKTAFIEFMSGMQAAIDLAHDEEFLESYTNKYYHELGEKAYILAAQCKEFFKENAQLAQNQFAEFLKYYHQQNARKAKDSTLRTSQMKRAMGYEARKINIAMAIILEDIKQGNVQSVDDLLNLVTFAHSQNRAALDHVEILQGLIAHTSPQIIQAYILYAVKLDRGFKDKALLAPINLFANPQHQRKSIFAIQALLAQGCKFSTTSHDGRSALAHCRSFIKRAQLANLFLGQEFLLPQDQALFDAVRRNDVRNIPQQISKNFDEVYDENGLGIVARALLLDHAESLAILTQELQKQKVNLVTYFSSKKDADDLSPIEIALESNSVKCLNFLLQKGLVNFAQINKASPKITNDAQLALFASTKLYETVTARNVTVQKVQSLIANKANIHAVFEGKTILENYLENVFQLSSKVDSLEMGKILQSFKQAGADVRSVIISKNYLQRALSDKRSDVLAAFSSIGVVTQNKNSFIPRTAIRTPPLTPQTKFQLRSVSQLTQTQKNDSRDDSLEDEGIFLTKAANAVVKLPNTLEYAIKKAHKAISSKTSLEQFKKDFLDTCEKILTQTSSQDTAALVKSTFSSANLNAQQQKTFAAACLSHENLGGFWEKNNAINKREKHDLSSAAIQQAAAKSFVNNFSSHVRFVLNKPSTSPILSNSRPSSALSTSSRDSGIGI